jgi:hypothetical protein
MKVEAFSKASPKGLLKSSSFKSLKVQDLNTIPEQLMEEQRLSTKKTIESP